MLEVRCPERLVEVRAWADKLGAEARQDFEGRLAYLEHYAQDGCVCDLYTDMAPYSFGFTIYKRQQDGSLQRWFNGGLIYYGPRETGVDSPQFSVSLSAVAGHELAAKARWEIHT